jgi:hypothetical protein
MVGKFKMEAVVKALVMFLLLLAVGYFFVAWNTFCIRHPKAGTGAFLVYFPEVMTFKTVPELETREP